MTFIRPNKTSVAFRIFLVLIIIGLAGGTFWLIALYNQTVALSHQISVAKTQLDTIGAENTSINNQIVTMLGDTGQLTAIATSDGLIVDSRPQYVTVAQ
jgi:cell division protein FtsB